MVKRRFACLECKRLKIKCDLARPRCEYCNARNRDCEYPDFVSKLATPPKESQVVTKRFSSDRGSRTPDSDADTESVEDTVDTSKPSLSFHQINAPRKFTGLNKYDQRLLDYLLRRVEIHYAPLASTEPICGIFAFDLPSLFMSSQLVRRLLLSYSAMRYAGCCREKLDYFVSRSRRQQPRNYDEELEYTYRQLEFGFNSSLQILNLEVAELTPQNWTLQSKSQVLVEVAMCNLFILDFVTVHLHRLLSLVLFDKQQPDYMSFSRGLREFFTTFAPVFINSQFLSIYEVPREPIFAPPPNMDPWCAMVAADLNGDHILVPAINLLAILINALVAKGNSFAIYRWMMAVPTEFMDLVWQKQLPALRVLFTFACSCMRFHMYVLAYNNMWIDYIEWFRSHNFELTKSETWVYPNDGEHYLLVQQAQQQVPSTT